MYQMTATFIDMYRQQLGGMHQLTTASISGLERAQQCALQMARQVLDQQLDAVGRAASHASQAMLDPEQVRPAVENMMRTQRDLAQAVSETQRRCVDAVTGQASQQDGTSVGQVTDAMQQTLQQWQRWTEQLFSVTREQTEQLARDIQRQQAETASASARAADDMSRRFESSAQHAGQVASQAIQAGSQAAQAAAQSTQRRAGETAQSGGAKSSRATETA